MSRKSSVLDRFASEVCEFIYINNLEDKNDNLILDYIEGLYKKGVDLKLRDVEQEVYTFYHYHKKYNNLLMDLGEDKFIDIITNAEIQKHTS